MSAQRRAVRARGVIAAASILLLAAAALMVAVMTGRQPPPQSALALGELLGGASSDGFARASATRALRFPADHGAHPEYRTEWWYFTGNLRAQSDRHFGFQLTFFRFALSPAAPVRSSAWATDQIYMAHFALTDTAARRHVAFERFERAALGLAGAQAQPFRVWLGDWSAASAGEELFPLQLTARSGTAALALELNASKPAVLHGDRGLSRKGPQAGNASYYYSFTRMAVTGQLRLAGEPVEVTGSGWLDREWGTSALGAGVDGWDWFALQLDDGRDVMFYRLRRADGGSEPYSGGSLVAPDGSRVALAAGDVVLESGRSWMSPATGIRYPLEWRLELPEQGLALDITPRIDNQEMALSVRYWEGSVAVTGRGPDGPVSGAGYVELAGYGGGDSARLGR